jgi:hypothetical protein
VARPALEIPQPGFRELPGNPSEIPQQHDSATREAEKYYRNSTSCYIGWSVAVAQMAAKFPQNSDFGWPSGGQRDHPDPSLAPSAYGHCCGVPTPTNHFARLSSNATKSRQTSPRRRAQAVPSADRSYARVEDASTVGVEAPAAYGSGHGQSLTAAARGALAIPGSGTEKRCCRSNRETRIGLGSADDRRA